MNEHHTIPKTMKAFVLHGYGGQDKLVYHSDWPTPHIGHNEVLIQVHACGLNNTDINTRTGWYSKTVTEKTTGKPFGNFNDPNASWGGAPLQFPRIQGADVVGKVVAIGKDASPSLLDQRVMVDTWIRDWDRADDPSTCRYFGSEIDGGFAAYTAVNYRNVHIINSSLSDVELASFATSYITAENMINKADVKSGDRVLITGASGGVGSALIQLVKRRGAIAIAIASEDKHSLLREKLSIDHILPRTVNNLSQSLQDLTGSAEVDVVADVVGGDLWPQYIEVLKHSGRYTCSGAIAGPIVSFDLRSFYLKDLTFTGATIIPAGLFCDLIRYIENNEIKPLVAAHFPLEELHTAQDMFVNKKHIGNIVVTI